MKTLYKGIMEGELNELPAFSSPEAKKLVENDIKKMSKILGKSSQLVIKIMMDGVKGGRYDAMDIQRAIMGGTKTISKRIIRYN